MKATKELLLAKTREYQTEDKCLGCVYFMPTKGHFGSCNAALNSSNNPNNKYYDGSKKGTGCSLWRTNIILPENTILTKEDSFKKLREDHNKSVSVRRIRIKTIRHIKYANYNLWPELTNVYKKPRQVGIIGLPFSMTSELERPKRGYFGMHFNKKIIEYAITQLEINKQLIDTQKKIQSVFGRHISLSTLRNWSIKFTGFKKTLHISTKKFAVMLFLIEHDLFANDLSETVTIKCDCGSSNIVKNGVRFNKMYSIQKYHCMECKKWFVKTAFIKGSRFNPIMIKKVLKLFSLGLSSREIVRVIKKENNIQISSPTVLNWIKIFIPNPQLQINGSHRPELRQKISIGIKKYHSEKKLERLLVVA